jgi:hypothetical protein
MTWQTRQFHTETIGTGYEKKFAKRTQKARLSAVSQNRPVMVEIKGVKTSHFMERKTTPVACLDAGLMGHVERPQSELSNHDIESARSRMVPATHCPGTGDQSGNGWPVSAIGKTGHFDHRL